MKLAAEEVGPEAPATGGGERRAVIVDQFEAVFTLCDDEDERTGLIGALCELARTALVVLALRADFYGQAIRYPGLRQALQERHVVLGPMTAGQVRDAVVRPALLSTGAVTRRTRRARCRCCPTRCSPPGSTAAAERSRWPTTRRAAGSRTR